MTTPTDIVRAALDAKTAADADHVQTLLAALSAHTTHVPWVTNGTTTA